MATFLASTARRQDSYGFALIGFTVPIITLSGVSQPLSVFQTAVDRCSSLLLGIGCAYASAALVAAGVGTARTGLADKVDAAARACAEWWRAGHERNDWGASPAPAVLALDAAVTDALIEHPSLRAGGQPIRDTAPALLGVLASGLLEERLPQAEKGADALLAWDRPGVGWRLRRCLATGRMLRRGRRVSARRTRSQPLAIDRDWRLAGNNAVRTMAAVSLLNAFWYMSEWSSGGAAVTFAGLVSVLLATRDDPARDALSFLKGAALANLIGTVAHYAVLTSTGDFLLLAAVVLPISMLAAAGRADKRAVSAGGFGITVFSALDPLNVMDYDLASALKGLDEDTRENHPQAVAAAQLDDVPKGLHFWTAKPRPYLIEKTLSSIGNRRSHLWTAWRACWHRSYRRASLVDGSKYRPVVFAWFFLAKSSCERFSSVSSTYPLNGVLANLLGVATAVLAFAALPPPASPATRRVRARRRIGRAVCAAALRPAILLPHPGRWCAPMFERAALLAPEGTGAVAEAHTLMLVGLLLLVLRRQDDALGRQAGRVITAGGPELSERLARLQASSSQGLQRRRLAALAALLEPGVPPGFPGLSPAAA